MIAAALAGAGLGRLGMAAFYEAELARLGRSTGRRNADNLSLSAKLSGQEG